MKQQIFSSVLGHIQVKMIIEKEKKYIGRGLKLDYKGMLELKGLVYTAGLEAQFWFVAYIKFF